MVKAIVYNSKTGFTKDYAKIISDETKIPCYTIEESKTELSKGDEIFYMGWIMAGSVKGFAEVSKLFTIKGVCGVGMMANEAQRAGIQKKCGLSEDIPVFQIQGGFDMSKLSGIDKFLMKIVKNVNMKKLNAKAELTESEKVIKKLFVEGGSCVSKANVEPIIAVLSK